MKLKVSEIFGPAGYWNFNKADIGFEHEFVQRWGVTQGEGQFIGIRSVFVRTFGCNLRCPSFGLDHGQKTAEPMEFAQRIHEFKNISETPAAQFGCDSYFSVYPEFKSLSPMLDVQDVAAKVIQTSGGSLLQNKTSPVHLILTGGEPMLPGWQRAYVDLVKAIKNLDPHPNGPMCVTIETNGTQPITATAEMQELASICKLTWSISPKLSVSGHSGAEAIFPEVVAQYYDLSDDLYLKFVVMSPNDFDEVDEVVERFENAVGARLKVFIMPEGGTVSEYTKHSTLDLVSEAVKRGYNITPRLQVMIGANLTGW